MHKDRPALPSTDSTPAPAKLGYDEQLRGVAASARVRRAEKIARLIATAPPLTDGQVQHLTVLLTEHPRAEAALR